MPKREFTAVLGKDTRFQMKVQEELYLKVRLGNNSAIWKTT